MTLQIQFSLILQHKRSNISTYALVEMVKNIENRIFCAHFTVQEQNQEIFEKGRRGSYWKSPASSAKRPEVGVLKKFQINPPPLTY